MGFDDIVVVMAADGIGVYPLGSGGGREPPLGRVGCTVNQDTLSIINMHLEKVALESTELWKESIVIGVSYNDDVRNSGSRWHRVGSDNT